MGCAGSGACKLDHHTITLFSELLEREEESSDPVISALRGITTAATKRRRVILKPCFSQGNKQTVSQLEFDC